MNLLSSTSLLVLALCCSSPFAFCQTFQWEQRADMPVPRWGASTFVIDGIAYVVGGKSGNTEYAQMWAYDPVSNTWSQKAPIPGPRRQAIALSINGKGYVGCGIIQTSTFLSDFWEYDPIANSWTQKASFPTGPRYNTWQFALNGIAYVGGGNSAGASGPFHADAFTYNPVTNTWSTGYPIPDQGRHGAVGFAMDGQGYVVCGRESNLNFVQDVWRFDASTLSWTSMPPFPGAARSSPLAMVYYNGAVIGCGRDASLNHYDAWFFDPGVNTWTTVPDYPGATAMAGTSFSIGDRAFAGLGWNLASDLAHQDLWELVKTDAIGIEEADSRPSPILLPNPVVDGSFQLVPAQPGRLNALLFAADGRMVRTWSIQGPEWLDVDGLPPGLYGLHWQQMEHTGVLKMLVR